MFSFKNFIVLYFTLKLIFNTFWIFLFVLCHKTYVTVTFFVFAYGYLGFPYGWVVKNLPVADSCRFSPWRRKWQPTPVFFPGEFHRQRSLVGYSPWGRKKLHTNNTFTFSQFLFIHFFCTFFFTNNLSVHWWMNEKNQCIHTLTIIQWKWQIDSRD